jgi:hypothetical protein
MPDWIGYRWLIERFGLTVTQALRTETVIGSTRATVSNDTTERRTVLEQLRPEASLAGHLSFALKHEGVHLEALSRLFAAAPATEVEDWIRREPTGRYARRTGFLYECLTGRRLDVPDTTRGNYVPVVDPELELVTSTPINNIRWRVRDNLLGNAGFSPQGASHAEHDAGPRLQCWGAHRTTGGAVQCGLGVTQCGVADG